MRHSRAKAFEEELRKNRSELEDAIINGETSYTPISNKSALRYADNMIKNQLAAQEQWDKVKDTYKIPAPKDIALGERLMMAAAQAGNAKDTLKFAAELSDMLTKAGQAVQAARLLKRMGSVGEQQNTLFSLRSVV